MEADVKQDFLDFMDEFKKQIKINKGDLDTECMNQPSLHQQIGEQQTKARNLYQKAKSRLKFVEADLATKIRANPSAYHVDKTTKEVVENIVVLQPEYKQADDDLIEISDVLAMLDVIVGSIDDRKSMLRDLVTLRVHSYYSEGDMTKEHRELIAAKQEEIVRARRRSANGQ
jgi:hypothetical protein